MILPCLEIPYVIDYNRNRIVTAWEFKSAYFSLLLIKTSDTPLIHCSKIMILLKNYYAIQIKSYNIWNYASQTSHINGLLNLFYNELFSRLLIYIVTILFF